MVFILLPNSQDGTRRTRRRYHQQSASRLRGTSRNGPRPLQFCATSTTSLSVWNHRHASLSTTASCTEKASAKMTTPSSNKTLKTLKRGSTHVVRDSTPRSATFLAPIVNSTISTAWTAPSSSKYHQIHTSGSPYQKISNGALTLQRWQKRLTPPSHSWEETCEHALYQVNVAHMSHWWGPSGNMDQWHGTPIIKLWHKRYRASTT